jgi:hypothetical protein
MDAVQFRERAEEDERVAKYLQVLSDETGPLVPDRTADSDAFFSLLAVATARALYLWLTLYDSARGGPPEAEMRQRLGQEHAAFTSTGATAEQIGDVIASVCSALAIRPPDEETVEVARALLD